MFSHRGQEKMNIEHAMLKLRGAVPALPSPGVVRGGDKREDSIERDVGESLDCEWN